MDIEEVLYEHYSNPTNYKKLKHNHVNYKLQLSKLPSLPCLGATLSEIEHLPRVQQPLELLHQLGSLVATTLGVDENDERLDVNVGNRLDGERPRVLVILRRERE